MFKVSQKIFLIYSGQIRFSYRWFTPEEVSEALDRVRKNPYLRVDKNHDPEKIFVPPKGAIANFMLKTWVENFAKSS
jgi:hypothetical protein